MFTVTIYKKANQQLQILLLLLPYLQDFWTVFYPHTVQHFVLIVSHFRHCLEELLVLLSTRWILDGNHDRLRNQMEGLIMHCLPWQLQSPTHLRLSLRESLSAPHSTQQQMGGRNYAVHWGLLKDALIFREPVCLCTEVYRTDFLPCVKSFCLHWGFRQAKTFLWWNGSLLNAKIKR